MKITLWVPSHNDTIAWPCVQAWWDLETPDNIKLRLKRTGANNLKYSWNEAVRFFLDDTKDDWLLSWHSDVVGCPKTLLRLLSWDQPIVSALIFMRTSPVMPHVWEEYETHPGFPSPRINDTRKFLYKHPEYLQRFDPFVMEPRPEDALTSAYFTSTSCMLIHRDVLQGMREEVKDVWFLMDDDLKGGGEDRRFCEHARLAGYETMVDRSCVVTHLVGNIGTSVADFVIWDWASTINGTGEPHEVIK